MRRNMSIEVARATGMSACPGTPDPSTSTVTVDPILIEVFCAVAHLATKLGEARRAAGPATVGICLARRAVCAAAKEHGPPIVQANLRRAPRIEAPTSIVPESAALQNPWMSPGQGMAGRTLEEGHS